MATSTIVGPFGAAKAAGANAAKAKVRTNKNDRVFRYFDILISSVS
jgi:hypothetical protein